MALRGSRLHIFIIHTWREIGQRVREQTRPTLSWTLRLTVAATAAYVVAMQFFDHQPLLAPLSALLVTQLTLFSAVRHGIKRVVAVIIGVLIAVGFASAVGLTWWSLAIAIAIGILVGQLLRLGDYVIEVPVTAMFVLAVQAGTTTAAVDRLLATAIGAGVGLLVNILVPPGERSPNAAAAVRRYAQDIAEAIRTVLDQMDGEITREQAQAWLTRARSLDYKTIHIDRMIDVAEEARVLNMRALNRPYAISSLRTGLYALEHSAVTLRNVLRGIRDAVWYPDENVDDAIPEGARKITRDVLGAIADVVTAFGAIVESQVQAPAAEREAALDEAMQGLRAVRLEADERLDSKVDPFAVRELMAVLVVAAGRILREFTVQPETARGETKKSPLKRLSTSLRSQLPVRQTPPDKP